MSHGIRTENSVLTRDKSVGLGKPHRNRYDYDCDCDQCGRHFTAKRSAKFCGATCRQRFRRDYLRRMGVDR